METLVAIASASLAALTVKDYIDIGAKAVTAAVALTAGVKWAKSRLEGIPEIEKNSATIKRHASTHAALMDYITRKNAPRSILMEGADIVYYAVRGENPPVLSFDMKNPDHVIQFQKILLNIDDPHKAYVVATGHNIYNEHITTCPKECAEFAARIKKRHERSWLKDRSDEKSNAIDEAMLAQVDALVKAGTLLSTGMTESCHIALKRTSMDDPSGDIVVMGITSQFQKAFERVNGVKDIGSLRNIGDNALFDKILETRRAMKKDPPSRLSALFKKAVEIGSIPVGDLLGKNPAPAQQETSPKPS